MTRIHYAHVDDAGRLRMDAPEAFRYALSAFTAKPVEVIVRPVRRQRSTRANRYYWGVVVKAIGEHCGYHSDEMHEALAFKFLRLEDDPITGSPRRKRTPETNTTEFAEYVDRCIQFGAELGVVIPEPGEVDVV